MKKLWQLCACAAGVLAAMACVLVVKAIGQALGPA